MEQIYYKGRPIESMTKLQLIELVKELFRAYQKSSQVVRRVPISSTPGNIGGR